MDMIRFELTEGQTESLRASLHLYIAVADGRLDAITGLVRSGTLHATTAHGGPVKLEAFEHCMINAAAAIGYRNEQSTPAAPEPAIVTAAREALDLLPPPDGGAVPFEVSLLQACAIRQATDLFIRIGLGQLTEIVYLLRDGIVRPTEEILSGLGDRVPDALLNRELQLAKAALGHPSNGSYGVGNRNVPLVAHRAYEIHKAIARTLAVHADPNPAFKGVDYDGVMVRYTSDPAPVTVVTTAPAAAP